MGSRSFSPHGLLNAYAQYAPHFGLPQIGTATARLQQRVPGSPDRPHSRFAGEHADRTVRQWFQPYTPTLTPGRELGLSYGSNVA